jgi:thioredoxin 1
MGMDITKTNQQGIPAMIVNVDHENFHEEVYHHDGPVVLTFGYSGCAPCRTLGVQLNLLAQDGVKVVKADITESPELATHFKINSVPTTLFFARGEPRIQWNGVANVHKLRKLVAEAVEDGERSPADHVHDELRGVQLI